MQGIYSKLQFAAIVLSLLGIIGGFTYTWGVFNNRLDVLENKELQPDILVNIQDKDVQSLNIINQLKILSSIILRYLRHETQIISNLKIE